MIIIRATRSEAETITGDFFRMINMYKRTRMENVKHLDRTSEEYLSALVINCLLTEIESLFQKKLKDLSRRKISVRLTDAQCVVLFKSLKVLPIDPNQVYYTLLRRQWVELLATVFEVEEIEIFFNKNPR